MIIRIGAFELQFMNMVEIEPAVTRLRVVPLVQWEKDSRPGTGGRGLAIPTMVAGFTASLMLRGAESSSFHSVANAVKLSPELSTDALI